MVDLAARKGDFKGAARYLQLSPDEQARGPELARKLRAVLERHLDIDIDAVSPLPEGSQQDGLPPGVDTVGSVPDGHGGKTRSSSSARETPPAPTGPSRARPCPASTAGTTRCPTAGCATGCRSTSSATGRPTSCGGSGWPSRPSSSWPSILGRVLGRLTTAFLHRLFLRTPTEWDERLLERTSPALTLLWAVAVAAVLLPWVALLPDAHRSVRSLLGGPRPSPSSGPSGARWTSGPSS